MTVEEEVRYTDQSMNGPISPSHQIRLVWPARLTFIKIIFFLNRYLPFLSVVLAFTSLWSLPHAYELALT